MPTPRMNPATLSRRAFHRSAAALAGSAVTGHFAARGLAAEPQPQPAAAGLPAGKYFDIHVHLGQPYNRRGRLSAEMMLRWMDAHHIAQAAVLPLISPESWFYPITPHWVLQQTKPFRDRLIPFCSVDPRTINLGGSKGIVDILNRYIDAGAKGFGEHKWGGPIDDPRNVELLGACGEVNLPVLFHLDNARNTDKPGLPGLDRVLGQVPQTRMIGHAQGFWASISGDTSQADLQGYPRGAVAPGGALDRLMDKHANLYADLSAGSGANAIRRDTAFGREFLIRHADRVLFGTDYLADGQEVPQFELLDELDLPAEARAKIFLQNARRLLNLV